MSGSERAMYTMTPAETWRALATAIQQGRLIWPHKNSPRWGARRTSLGLCFALLGLRNFAGMPRDQLVYMLNMLYNHRPANLGYGSGYYYPLNGEGDAKRAQLCLRLAELCEVRNRVDLESVLHV